MSDLLNQLAFEIGQPAENGDGYLFTQEQFDEFARAVLAQEAGKVEPILIQAVAVTREDDDEGLRLEWLLEGGISELEFAGTMLFAIPDANDLCDKDGSAEIYTSPPAPVAADELQAIQDRHEAWMAGVEQGKAEALVMPEQIELVAQTIYQQWSDRDGFLSWVPKGNSIMQDEARSIARACLDKVKELNQ